MSRYEERSGLLVPCRRIIDPTAVSFGMPPASSAVAAAPPISRVGSDTAAATSITVPTHSIGDCIVIAAYRTNATPPTIPGTYQSINSGGGGGTQSMSIGYRIATATNDASGTWTNAQRLVVAVYTGTHATTPIGNVNGTGNALTGTSGSADTDNITLTSGHNDRNWFIECFSVISGDAWVTAPSLTGMTNVNGGTTIRLYDTNGAVSADYTAQSNFYSSSGWRTFGFELRAA